MVKVISVSVMALFVAALLSTSCKKDDSDNSNEEPLPAGLQYVYNDTLYIIPDSAVAYAGPRDTPNHLDVHAYLYAEYLIASDSIRNGGRQVFHGEFAQYRLLPWNERYMHLPAPFTHDVMTDTLASYYFMIGHFSSQFGWGWQDTYNGGSNPWAQAGSADWTQPAAGLAADNVNTIAFDGESTMMSRYRAMITKRPR
ncbi:MAG TPA: hypothetical protein VGL38_05770 [bacterium]|jgi:hypothetical protein